MSELAQPGVQPFKLLDRFGRSDTFDEAIATISAGYMSQSGQPVVSRDGTIHLHDPEGRAPHLKEVLEARKGKSLTIAFMYDDLNYIIKQRYAAYTKGSCLWSGDTESVTVFGAEVKVYPSGTAEYERVMADSRTKLHYSIFFGLAEWLENGARMDLTDGFGNYRIRTTSYNSVRNLVTEYKKLTEIWRGPFKGIPFELTLAMRQGNGPDGKKRSFPVFNFLLKPRGTALQLTTDNFRQLVLSGNKAAASLSLPPPRELTPEDDVRDAHFADADDKAVATSPVAAAVPAVDENAAFEAARRTVEVPDPEADQIAEDTVLDAEFKDVEPTPEQLRNLQQNKDPEAMKRRFFATVKGSHLDSDDARKDFLGRHMDGSSSLSQVVGALTPANFDEIILAAEAEITEHRKETAAQAKLETPKGYHPSVTPRDAHYLVQAVKAAELKRFDVYPFISMIIGRHVYDRAQITSEDIAVVLAATGGGLVGKAGEWAPNEPRIADLVMDFVKWQNEEGVEGVL